MLIALLHNAVSPEDSAADLDVLVQAEAVGKALTELGHDWTRLPCTLDLATLRDRLGELRPDAVFNLAESLGGSDWLAHLVTALLDTLGMPYTGGRTEALFLTNHKVLAKRRLQEAGLPTPAWLDRAASSYGKAGQATFEPEERYMLKAICEHASFGLDEENVIAAESREQLASRLGAFAARLGRPAFAERFIEGREFNLSVLGGPDGPTVLPPAEIDFSAFPPGKPRIVGQRAKWADDSFEFSHTPRSFDVHEVDRPLLADLQVLARDAWLIFGLTGYARVDFRVDGAGRPWILEINANPCLSPDAGFAAALERASIPFARAIERILADAFVSAGPK
jgi:D-alanine-D-alanine ligase